MTDEHNKIKRFVSEQKKVGIIPSLKNRTDPENVF